MVVKSRTQAGADGVLAAVDKNLTRLVDKGKLDDDERKLALDRITGTDHLGRLADCDLVIESVVEDLAVKRELVRRARADREGRRASSPPTRRRCRSSTWRCTRERPDKVIGIHFFNPAPMMSLVEVVRPLTASDDTVAAAVAFAAACGKDAVEVTDRAGFVVNALLFPYLNNAVRMWENGTASKEAIDTAMQGGCNFPMGPFALLDLVGIDTSLAILDALYEEFRDPNYAAVPTLRRMATAGKLGRKSGEGFYRYWIADPPTALSIGAVPVEPPRRRGSSPIPPTRRRI